MFQHRKDATDTTNTAIAVFANHEDAEKAVKKLAEAGFDMKQLSIVAQGYHTEEKIVGFYNIGDRIKFWGSRGLFWGALWGLFFTGAFSPPRWSAQSSCWAI